MTRIAPSRQLPATDANPRVRLGDNRPPRPVLHQLARDDFDEAIAEHDGLEKRIADLVDSAGRAVATDDETAGRCTELLRQIAAVEKVVDREREAVKAPFLEAERIIDDAARGLTAKLTEARRSVAEIHRAYVRKKQDEADARKRAQAERQRERINAERAAAGKAEIAADAMPVETRQAAPVRIRSEFGGIATATREKIVIVTDWALAFGRVAKNAQVQAAVQKALEKLVRAGETDLPGVELADDVGARVR